MFILVFCLLTLDILLPEEVISVNEMVASETGHYLLDNRAQVVWHLSSSGELRTVYDKKGSGPGAIGRLGNMSQTGDGWVLTDFQQHKFLLLDAQWQLVREVKIGTLPRGAFQDGERLFLIYPNQKLGKMVHLESGGPELSFGSTIGEEDLFGFDDGEVLLFKGKYWFIHYFLPQIEAFDTQGKRLHRLTLPSFQPDPLVKAFKRERGITVSFRYSLEQLVRQADSLLIKLRDGDEEEAWFYRFDPEQLRFGNRFKAPLDSVHDGETIYEVAEDEATGRLRLKTFKIPPSQLP